ncbi:MAG: Endonuclease/exonuclease/phosphatase [Verrucomicrobia bacterium]|nr:Endonuclease/exonuclease/phosphatase [Verrucomicrobiota bacterium]
MQRVRLLTFNIAHARGLNPIQGLTSQRKMRLNLRKIAKLLDTLKPDIVALQEIDERSRWAGNFDHLEYLRLHAGFPHAVFGINNRRKGLLNLSYGNAFLSRHPIVATETIAFGKASVGEKGFVFAEFDLGGKLLPVVNLHLHFSSREHRIRQLGRLLAWLREKQSARRTHWHVPPLICGDFNNPGTSPDATAALLSHLSDYWDYALHPVDGRTFPSPLPQWMLDFVFLPPMCHAAKSQVVRAFISDHRPVMVDFDLS